MVILPVQFHLSQHHTQHSPGNSLSRAVWGMKEYEPSAWHLQGHGEYMSLFKDVDLYFAVVFLDLEKIFQYPAFSHASLQKCQPNRP